MSILEIHGTLANTCLYFTIAMMLWSGFLYIRRQDLDGSFFGAAVILELLLLLQSGLGAWMLIEGGAVFRWVHILYGILAIITVPAVYAFTRGRNTYYEALIYGLVFLFLMGVVLRGADTALPFVPPGV